MRDDIFDRPVIGHARLIHARWPDLIEKYLPPLIFFPQPVQKLRFVHIVLLDLLCVVFRAKRGKPHVNYTSYAVVGFGEAKPPQDLPFPACGGGEAATTRGKERTLEGHPEGTR